MATDSWGHSWGGPFTRFVRWGAFEQATTPDPGPPFIDLRCALITTLGALSPLVTALGARATIAPEIELYGHIAPVEVVATEGAFRTTISPEIELQLHIRSPRIDRSLS